jgi:ferrous iron transport protein B
MHQHSPVSAGEPSPDEPVTLLVGNPNVGKSVLFGLLTGRYTTVSNYPGTTEDEQVTRDALLAHLGRENTRVVQVCDAKNLRRGVFLALQLAELGVPMVLVANLLDEARARGFALDAGVLREALGVEVLESVAIRGTGLASLLAGSLTFRPCPVRVGYGAPIEAAVAAVEALLPAGQPGRRGLALLLLSGDRTLLPWARQHLGEERLAAAERIRAGLAARLGEPVGLVLDRARLAAAEAIVARALRRERNTGASWAARLGGLTVHPLWGWPVAAAILYLIYLFVGVLGAGEAVDFLENRLFGQVLTPWLDGALRPLLPGWLETALVGPPGTPAGEGPGLLIGSYGLISMGLSYAFAIILPIVTFFFLAFSVLEDSGYLPRLAVVLNRVFRLLGLNGKAVLPMILGLGCDTMATMTARIMTTPKERILVTLLLALGVPCSAQLGVILGLLGGLSLWAVCVWLATVAGVMVLVGFIASRVLPGQGSDFLLEIPPLRRPVLLNLVVKTLARVEWYLKEVVPLFLLGTFLLWLLERLSVLGAVQRVAAPLVQGALGLPARATDAFLIGFLRRDYGAAGLYDLFKGELAGGAPPMVTQIQIVVALVTLTLFVPCIANLLMIVKERGVATAVWMSAFIFPFAFVVGAGLNFVLRGLLL